MNFTLTDKLFSYFGVGAKLNDTYKDGSGRGINERYQRSLGAGYDSEIQDLLDNGLDNLVVPATMKAALIPVMEYMLGNIVYISSDVAIRRKLIQFAHNLYNVKGTHRGYEIPLRMLGFTTIEIIVETGGATFDTGTFDDDFRTFDSEDAGCGCVKYRLVLTGPIFITAAILEAVQRIVIFNEPVNAHLTDIEYHGLELGIGSMIIEDTFIVG